MTAFLKASTWIAGVFIVIKCIFKYLAWLYHDKDEPLREAVRLTWDYLSQHTYFEVARAALQRLYDRLAYIFQKKIRFFYLFLFFLLLNAASLCLGNYLFGIDTAELKYQALIINELVPPEFQLTTVDMMGSAMHPFMAVVSVFQLTILDLYSFLFTMGIIFLACRCRSFALLLFELITDISILFLFFGLSFFLLYSWLLTNLSFGIFSSFSIQASFSWFFLISYFAFIYMGNPNSTKILDLELNPFSVLAVIVIFLNAAFIIMDCIWLFSRSLRTTTFGISLFMIYSTIFLIPIVISWPFIIFKIRPQDKTESIFKVITKILFWLILSIGILVLILDFSLLSKLYELLSSARNLRFVFILVLSSALPSLAHLLAIAAALIAKATPKRLQQFINRHLDAISKDDDKVLNQLGNAFGGLGALITAIIQLI